MTPFEIIAQTTQAISSNPNDAEAYKQRALTLCQMQQYEDAMTDLNTLIDALHTDDPEIFQLRGTLHMQRGDKTHALDLDPSLMQKLTGEYKTNDKCTPSK